MSAKKTSSRAKAGAKKRKGGPKKGVYPAHLRRYWEQKGKAKPKGKSSSRAKAPKHKVMYCHRGACAKRPILGGTKGMKTHVQKHHRRGRRK